MTSLFLTSSRRRKLLKKETSVPEDVVPFHHERRGANVERPPRDLDTRHRKATLVQRARDILHDRRGEPGVPTPHRIRNQRVIRPLLPRPSLSLGARQGHPRRGRAPRRRTIDLPAAEIAIPRLCARGTLRRHAQGFVDDDETVDPREVVVGRVAGVRLQGGVGVDGVAEQADRAIEGLEVHGAQAVGEAEFGGGDEAEEGAAVAEVGADGGAGLEFGPAQRRRDGDGDIDARGEGGDVGEGDGAGGVGSVARAGYGHGDLDEAAGGVEGELGGEVGWVDLDVGASGEHVRVVGVDEEASEGDRGVAAHMRVVVVGDEEDADVCLAAACEFRVGA